MDLALDDVIKQQRKGRGGGSGGGGRGRASTGGVKRRGGGGCGARGGGRGGGGMGGAGVFRMKPGSIPSGKWRHQGGGLSTGGRQSLGSTAKLLISNLDYGVSDNDIKGLFSEFGATRRAVIHHDQSGRSLGSGEVVFERQVDAQRAITEYNNVPFDGRPMKISMFGAGMAVMTSASGDGNARVIPQQQQQRRQMNGGGTPRVRGAGRGGGGRGRGSTGGAKKESTSQEDLDEQLDALIEGQKNGGGTPRARGAGRGGGGRGRGSTGGAKTEPTSHEYLDVQPLYDAYGRPMMISMVGAGMAVMTSASGDGNASQSNGGGTPRARGAGRGGGGRGRGSTGGAQVTSQENLDAFIIPKVEENVENEDEVVKKEPEDMDVHKYGFIQPSKVEAMSD